MATHMERSRERIARVRAENLARKERQVKPKPKVKAKKVSAPAKAPDRDCIVPSEHVAFSLTVSMTTPQPGVREFFPVWEDGRLVWYD